METRQLGTSDLRLTVIGFGAWAIGGPGWRFGWGPQDDPDSVAAIRRALDLGVNWIDTAAVYGLGHSEEVVARALEGLPGGRRPYVFTKCSLVWDANGQVSHNLRPASLRREVEGSLRRLRTSCIDLYQIHWPRWPAAGPDYDPGPIEDAWATLAALRQEGKVRWIGVSNFDETQLARIQGIAPVTSVQPPYSLVRRGIETSLLPYCLEHRIGVIVYSPMQSGLLTGAMTRERIAAMPADDWRRTGAYFQEPKLSEALAIVEKLKAIGARSGRLPGEVAIAWTLRHPAVTAAIVGARRADQVDGIVGAADLRLEDADLRTLAT